MNFKVFKTSDLEDLGKMVNTWLNTTQSEALPEPKLTQLLDSEGSYVLIVFYVLKWPES